MANAVIHVQGMTCSHCKKSVEKALQTIDGVKNAKIDLETGNVTIDYDQQMTDENNLRKTISDAGYDVS